MKTRTLPSKLHIGAHFAPPLLYAPAGHSVLVFLISNGPSLLTELHGPSDRVKLIAQISHEDSPHLVVASSHELLLFRILRPPGSPGQESASTDCDEALWEF